MLFTEIHPSLIPSLLSSMLASFWENDCTKDEELQPYLKPFWINQAHCVLNKLLGILFKHNWRSGK